MAFYNVVFNGDPTAGIGKRSMVRPVDGWDQQVQGSRLRSTETTKDTKCHRGIESTHDWAVLLRSRLEERIWIRIRSLAAIESLESIAARMA